MPNDNLTFFGGIHNYWEISRGIFAFGLEFCVLRNRDCLSQVFLFFLSGFNFPISSSWFRQKTKTVLASSSTLFELKWNFLKLHYTIIVVQNAMKAKENYQNDNDNRRITKTMRNVCAIRWKIYYGHDEAMTYDWWVDWEGNTQTFTVCTQNGCPPPHTYTYPHPHPRRFTRTHTEKGTPTHTPKTARCPHPHPNMRSGGWHIYSPSPSKKKRKVAGIRATFYWKM